MLDNVWKSLSAAAVFALAGCARRAWVCLRVRPASTDFGVKSVEPRSSPSILATVTVFDTLLLVFRVLLLAFRTFRF